MRNAQHNMQYTSTFVVPLMLTIADHDRYTSHFLGAKTGKAQSGCTKDVNVTETGTIEPPACFYVACLLYIYPLCARHRSHYRPRYTPSPGLLLVCSRCRQLVLSSVSC